MTKILKRIGECNMCGQCCGAIGSPNQGGPWSSSWPTAFDSWDDESTRKSFPLIELIVLPKYGGGAGGKVIIADKEYAYEWVPKESLCKSSDNFECPFLGGNPNEDIRPCALVGTQYEYIWRNACYPQPPLEEMELFAKKWFENYPKCSFKYVEDING